MKHSSWRRPPPAPMAPPPLLPFLLLLLAALPVDTAAAAAPPRWGAFVINMRRRADRLQRFQQALQERQPWLLANGSTCRIPGRDGGELRFASEPWSPSPPSLRGRQAAAAPAKRLPRPRLRVARNISNPIPLALGDASGLLASGLVTAAALETAASGKTYWPELSAGGIGLYLGHADAWRAVLVRGLDYGLVFEDDLTLFSPGFESAVKEILARPAASNRSTWDMLYLQRCDDRAWPKERASGRDAEVQRPSASFGSVEVQVNAGETVTCTGAYVVTRRGAEKLLAGGLPAKEQLDQQLGSVPGLARAAVSPPLAQCQEVFTDRSGVRHRDTDVQQHQEHLRQSATALDAAAAKWISYWRRKHHINFMSGRGAGEIRNC